MRPKRDLSQFCLACLLLVCAATANAGESDAIASERDKIPRWVADLDSDRFDEREAATEKLIAVGASATEPLSNALGTGSLEMVTRGIYVLQKMALVDDAATKDAAQAALQRLATTQGTPAARRARAALQSINRVISSRALAQLENLGATIGRRNEQVEFQVVTKVDTVRIGGQWKGNDDDLDKLKRLNGIRHVIFTGPQVNDTWIEKIRPLDTLEIISIAHAKITDEGLIHLKHLPNLRDLHLWFSPISDSAVEHLKELRNIQSIRLYGTEMTREAGDRLTELLDPDNAKDPNHANQDLVDIRNGGFLGVGGVDDRFAPEQNRKGCTITRVEPHSAAAEHKIRAGDVITHYNGSEVNRFSELTRLIGRNGPGEEVELRYLRGPQTNTARLKLGKWELRVLLNGLPSP